jgi:hypothetical protein
MLPVLRSPPLAMMSLFWDTSRVSDRPTLTAPTQNFRFRDLTRRNFHYFFGLCASRDLHPLIKITTGSAIPERMSESKFKV